MNSDILISHFQTRPGAPTSGFLLADIDTLGGLTLDLRTGRPPTGGYVGSTFKQLEVVVDYLTSETIYAFIRANAGLLATPGHLLGLWRSGAGRWVLDVVTLFSNRADAVAAGREADQESMWDVANQCVIPCNP
jgi:hypothetical protein